MKSLVMFCGMGGTTEGMVRAGLDVRAAVDSWPIACEAHRRWHPDIPTWTTRCENVDETGVAGLRGPFDFVWASPSCKPWSNANRSPRRGQAHPEYYSLPLLLAQMQWLKARWLVIENVLGLVQSKEGKEEMARFAAEAKRRGLSWNYTIVRASDCGVAQLRRRVIIVVGPEMVTIPAGMPSVPIEPGGIVDASQPSRHRNWTARAITANRGGTNGSDVSRRCVRATRGGGKDSAEYRKVAQRSVMGPHGSTTNPRAYDSGGEHGQVYHEARTLAECCELQHVPLSVLDGFTKTAAHALVGNAVPPPVAEWVCRTVMRADGAVDPAGRSMPAPFRVLA